MTAPAIRLRPGVTIRPGVTLSAVTQTGGGSGPGFEPTGTPSSWFGGMADFEMGVYDPGNNSIVPDLTGHSHTLGLNNATYSGASTNYYHFLNNSAQANDWNWPLDGTSNLAIMGWFAFGSLSGNISLVSRNEGSSGWALRIDNSGSTINLVKYNVSDQKFF